MYGTVATKRAFGNDMAEQIPWRLVELHQSVNGTLQGSSNVTCASTIHVCALRGFVSEQPAGHLLAFGPSLQGLELVKVNPAKLNGQQPFAHCMAMSLLRGGEFRGV